MAAAGPLPRARLTMRRWILLAVLAGALVFPLVAGPLGWEFYVGFASRIMIYALAASSLNLILGYGGMLSFGHAAFVGAGAYVVGILMAEGVASAWLSWPLSIVVAGALAAAVGAISLRTRGVYFIMITLAFAQMLYYISVGMKAYGGEEGLNLATRSSVGFGLNLKDDATFYYVVLAILVAGLYCLHRLANARFGRAVVAIRENETRMEAIGFPTYRYKLACFAIGGAVAGLAGALLANQNSDVNPNLLYWTQSGSLMIMVILGGVGTLYGGLLGAVALLVLEEVFSAYTIHWQLGVGAILLAIVLFAPRGLAGLLARARDG
jgi:branched-chain amino acid transport system permease protein